MGFNKTFGSRAEVFHGNAKKTTGGLMKKDLLRNKHGAIVSKKKFLTAKKERRLQKYGYFTKKGKFGFVKKGVQIKPKKERQKKGRINRERKKIKQKKYKNEVSNIV